MYFLTNILNELGELGLKVFVKSITLSNTDEPVEPSNSEKRLTDKFSWWEGPPSIVSEFSWQFKSIAERRIEHDSENEYNARTLEL